MSHAIKSKRPNDLNCALYIAVREDKPENFSVELLEEFTGASRSTGCDRRTIQRQLSGESNTGSAHSLGNLKYIWRYKE